MLTIFGEETTLFSGGRLSSSEEAEYRRCLREMRAEGIDVNSPDDSPEYVSAFDVTIVGGLVSLIFNLPSGLAGYAIWLRLVARGSGLILLEQCEMATEFDDQIELECFDRGGPICQLGQCKHHESEVLNDRFPLRFHRGDLIEGVILATGLKPIPKEYIHGMMVPFKLTFWDQFRNEISAESKLSVDRSTTPRPRLVRPQSSLHDSGEIPGTHEPFGREEPGVQEAPIAMSMEEARKPTGESELDPRE